MKRITRSLFFSLLYKMCCELSYALGVSDMYSYMGLVYTPNIMKCIVSYVLFIMGYFILPKNKDKPSYYLVRIMYLFTLTPLLSMYWQADRANKYMIYAFMVFIIICLVTKHICIKKIKLIECNISISKMLILIISFILILFTLRFGIADLRALNLYNVYEIRSERFYPGIWGYIINWLTYALIPALICRSLSERRYGIAALALVYQGYLYLFTGSKTVLFSIVLIIVSYFLVMRKFDFLRYWSLFLGIVCIFPLFLYLQFGSTAFIGIFPTRLLSIPASINFNHYDFFSENPKLYLCETIIGRIFNIESPYGEFSTYLLSTGSGNANVGFIGDAYDNGGVVFIVIYAILIGLLLEVFDKIYEKNKTQLAAYVGTLTYTMIYLNEGPLTSAIITGGIWIHLALFLLKDKKTIQTYRYNSKDSRLE